MILKTLQDLLQRYQDAGLLRVLDDFEELDAKPPSELAAASSQVIDFHSSDYLGLATDQEFRARFLDALAQDRLMAVGSGGSRTASGNSPYHVALERKIAAFHGAEAALVFNSGFDANYGVFSSLPQPGDAIVYDRLCHASIREGIRASRASQKLRCEHNSTEDLRRVLGQLATDPAFQSGDSNVFVAVESLYSMDADVCPLGEFSMAMKEIFPKGNAYMIVDEASHSPSLRRATT